jgi:hypothetical protein
MAINEVSNIHFEFNFYNLKLAYLASMLKRSCLVIVLLGILCEFSSAQKDTIRILQYNILRFPEGNSQKAPLFRPIVNYLQPDLIGLNELTEASAIDSLKKYVFNDSVFGVTNWIQEGELMGAMFYRKSKLRLASQFPIQTSPRFTNVYRFYSTNQNFESYPDTVWMTNMLVHFKSSQGSDNENLRAQQAADIRIYANNRHPSNNFILQGDLNLYSSDEPAWQNLRADGQAQFVDFINREGDWSNNINFADVHTQSPRTASFDLGVTGGMDDRFDFILGTRFVRDGNYGLQYIEDSYSTPGNDGAHYNTSILANPPNTSAPDSVIQALHDLADHLPVMAAFEFDYSAGFNAVNEQNEIVHCSGFNFDLANPVPCHEIEIWNLLGERMPCMEDVDWNNQNLKGGIYIIMLKNKEFGCRYKIVRTNNY